MIVEPYLFFDGRCEEAVEFYRSAAGAQVEGVMRWKESPDKGQCAPGYENKVMHAAFRIGDSLVMASDGNKPEPGKTFQGFSLALTVDTPAEADQRFNALSAGGQVLQPLAQTFFSPRFGMLTDRFGVMWMVLVKGK
jgi:PhnB protein